MLIASIWLFLLGTLGVLAQFAHRSREQWPRWLLYSAQIVVGLNTFFWGLWGVISAVMMAGIASYSPAFWATNLVSALLEITLPVLFALTLLAALGNGESAKRVTARRRLLFAQGAVGALAIVAGIANLVIVAGVLAS